MLIGHLMDPTEVHVQMKIANLIFSIFLISGFAGTETFAGPKHRGGGPPPGLAKKGGVPPGLKKKGGMPPGMAKKYVVGEGLPKNSYHRIEPKYKTRLPYLSPEGKKWVRVGRDLYLLRNTTETIVDVIENWLD